MKKHTPTPWECDSKISNHDSGPFIDWVIYSSDPKEDGAIVDTFNAQYLHDEEQRAADAAFIVRAVNCHEDLVLELEKTLDNAVYMLAIDNINGTVGKAVQRNNITRLQNLLAKAKGAA